MAEDFKYVEVPGAEEVKAILDAFVGNQSPLSDESKKLSDSRYFSHSKENEEHNLKQLDTLLNSFKSRIIDISDETVETDFLKRMETLIASHVFRRDDDLAVQINDVLKNVYSSRNDLYTLSSYEKTIDDNVNGDVFLGLFEDVSRIKKLDLSIPENQKALDEAEENLVYNSNKLNGMFSFHERMTKKGEGSFIDIPSMKSITDAQASVENIWAYYLKKGDITPTVYHNALLSPESIIAEMNTEVTKNLAVRSYNEDFPYVSAIQSFDAATNYVNDYLTLDIKNTNWKIENKPEGAANDGQTDWDTYNEGMVQMEANLLLQSNMLKSKLFPKYKSIYKYIYSSSKSEYDSMNKKLLSQNIKELNDIQDSNEFDLIESVLGSDFIELAKADALIEILQEDKSRGGFVDSLEGYKRRYFEEIFMADNPSYKGTFEEYMDDEKLETLRPPDDKFLKLIDKDRAIDKENLIEWIMKNQ